MSVLILVFTPDAPSFSEVASALADFPGGRVSPGDLFDELSVCDASSPAHGGDANPDRCVRLVSGPTDPVAEARRLAKHWPAGLAPDEVAVLRVEYDRETVALVRRIMIELAERYRFFVETASGKLHSAEGFARRCVREPGPWWERSRTRTDSGSAGRRACPDEGRVGGSAGAVAARSVEAPLPIADLEGERAAAGGSGFAAWRPLGGWSPPGAPLDGHLAVLAVVSTPSGPAIELNGRAVPGLLGWFARRLRAWEGELRARDPDLLRRPAAHLFLAARAAGPEEAQQSERVAWYPGVVESGRGYGDAAHGAGGWVDLRLGELIGRAARMLEGH